MDIIDSDINSILDKSEIPWQLLNNKNVLITGGTGLIGSMLIKTLVKASRRYELNTALFVLARNPEKLSRVLDPLPDMITVIEGDIERPIIVDNLDYIIHGAYPTASSYFNSFPVETLKSGIVGTMNMLETARQSSASRFLFLSSMEVYGSIEHEDLLTENDLGSINLYSSRSCYPESKRMCENMLSCYSKEYDLSTSSIRLAQTFGPGVPIDDRRVFAMMARCAINGEDIVLNTSGQSKHQYLYSADAVSAILTVLLKGENNTCYNAANPETYCSIFEMGQLVANTISEGRIKVVLDIKDTEGLYPPPSFLNLDITRIKGLGWNAEIGLEEMFRRMIAVMKY